MKKWLSICFLLLLWWHQSLGQKTASEISGDYLQFLLPATAFTSTLFLRDGQKGTLRFTAAMISTEIITHTLKPIIDKPRPNGGRYSFPSGHTSSAFTGAAFMQRRYGWKVGAPAYLLASYVGYTRIKARKHDGWDVLGGAIIGTGSAYLFAKPFKKKNTEITISPSPGSYQLNIVHRF